MTFRQRHLTTFRREPLARVLWQPRLEHWYNVNRAQGTLPERYQGIGHLELYDDLNCSPRGYFMFNQCFKTIQQGDVETATEQRGELTITTVRTPVGEIQTVHKRTTLSHMTVEYFVKTPADMKVQEYLLQHERVEFDWDLFREQDARLGDRGAPTIYLPRVNLQRMFINYMGFENAIYALHDFPAETEALIQAIDLSDDRFYEAAQASPIEIIDYGDNVDANMLCVPHFEKYVLPYYQRRTTQLRAAGKRTHCHWDGALKPLLPYCRECGFDGFEALTPEPQGDVTLEQIKEALGDELILVDGIPCTHFLPQHSYEEVEQFTLKILDMFAPNIVLGISDEISPPGDIEKVRLISEIVESYSL